MKLIEAIKQTEATSLQQDLSREDRNRNRQFAQWLAELKFRRDHDNQNQKKRR